MIRTAKSNKHKNNSQAPESNTNQSILAIYTNAWIQTTRNRSLTYTGEGNKLRFGLCWVASASTGVFPRRKVQGGRGKEAEAVQPWAAACPERPEKEGESADAESGQTHSFLVETRPSDILLGGAGVVVISENVAKMKQVRRPTWIIIFIVTIPIHHNDFNADGVTTAVIPTTVVARQLPAETLRATGLWIGFGLTLRHVIVSGLLVF